METNIIEQLNIIMYNQEILHSDNVWNILLLSFVIGVLLSFNITLKYDWFK